MVTIEISHWLPSRPHAGDLGQPFTIFVALEAVDMRKSFNGLWTAASERLQEDPKSGAVFCLSTGSARG